MNALPVKHLTAALGDKLISLNETLGETTCEVVAADIAAICVKLRDDKKLQFETLIDLCGIDYATWGIDDESQGSGSPGGAQVESTPPGAKRFAVVYHLLSLSHNWRLRLRAFVDDPPAIDSVVEVWAAANWYEREAFDLFGIVFRGHPDLRRLLTDYGFIGHPLRKDFPLSGQVEMRYDEKHGRVVYQPVTIEPRILVPRTISKPVGDSQGATKQH